MALSASVDNKTFCEFFAGIGLVWEGLRPSGWECVYSNDIDPKKKNVFESHFGRSGHFHLGDIWHTDEVVKQINDEPFLATASFPCTDLSLAGYWKGLGGKESSAYFGFLNVLNALGDRKPPLVMLENVPSFLTSGKGKDFPAAMKALADLGYWIDAFIVDAKDFVPQSRPRLFVVALHEKFTSPLMVKESRVPLYSAPWRQTVEASGALHPKALAKVMEATELSTGWFTLSLSSPKSKPHNLAAVIDLDPGQDWWDAERVRIHYERMHDYCRVKIDEMVKNKATFVSTAYRRTRKEVVRTEVRFDGIAGCLRTTKGGSARQIVIAVKKGVLMMRWMSPREYARLQGAADYKLVGENENQQMFGFGDAVCVPVIEWVDKNVLTPLFETAKPVSGTRPRTKALAG
jgi:DNA (cytosine-5)-methyltransferase 1